MDIYVVEQGDTIYQIGERYNMEPEIIMKANGIKDAEQLIVGQSIVIPGDNGEKIGSIIVNGYCYPNVNRDILRQALPYLTYLSIFSYQVTAAGDVVPIDDLKLLQKAALYDTAGKMVITNIDESGMFSSNLAHEILSDIETQNILLENAMRIMELKGYEGLDVDFEYLYPDDRDEYNEFMQRAKIKLDASGFSLSAALAPKVSADQPGLLYEAHDYNAHGQSDDEVILMTYEWGYLYGPPMAVAPLEQVRRVIEYAVMEIPSEKILMGIPNYGYDWTLPYEKGSAARTISNMQALEIAREYGAEIEFDSNAMSPYFTYYDRDKKEHIVWFEDARSIFEKLHLVAQYNLGGISYWTVNNEFPQNWEVLDALYDIDKII